MHELSVEKTSSIPLSDLIESVVNGDDIVFTKEDKPVAKLVAVKQERPRPQFGSGRGLFTLSEDFDKPLEDFEEYLK